MFQEITIIGNLGQDPEMRYTPNGYAVTNFSVATTRKWKDANGSPQEETTWIRVSVWGKQAEACNQYLSKGRQVFIKARFSTPEPKVWQDKNGNHRASWEVTAHEVKFLGGKGNGQTGAVYQEDTDDPLGLTDEEIPF